MSDPPPVPCALELRATDIVATDLAVPYGFSEDRWRKAFPGDTDVARLCDTYSGLLRRPDLTRIGDLTRAGDACGPRRLLLATIMWGYGPEGGRSYLAARRVTADGERTRRVLTHVHAALSCHDSVRAYQAFAGGLDGYRWGSSPSTSTSPAGGDPGWPEGVARPLILDSRLVATREFLANCLGIDWEAGMKGRRTDARRYGRYCDVFAAWSGQLECLPDQLEAFCFQQSVRFEPGPLLLALSTDLAAAGELPPPLRAAYEALPESLRAESARRVDR